VEQKLLPPISSDRLSVTKVPQASHLTINEGKSRWRPLCLPDLWPAGAGPAISRLKNV